MCRMALRCRNVFVLVGLYALVMPWEGWWVLPVACVLKGIDLADLDSDPIGKVPPSLLKKEQDDGVLDGEKEKLKQQIEDASDRLRVSDLGRKMNPQFWGEHELELFKQTEKQAKRSNAMYGVGGGFASTASLLAAYGHSWAFAALGALILALSTPFWVVGLRAAKKRKRTIKELMDSEARKAFQQMETERLLRKDEEIATALRGNAKVPDEEIAMPLRGNAKGPDGDASLAEGDGEHGA